jgi:hypothetical protein
LKHAASGRSAEPHEHPSLAIYEPCLCHQSLSGNALEALRQSAADLQRFVDLSLLEQAASLALDRAGYVSVHARIVILLKTGNDLVIDEVRRAELSG